MNRLFDPDSPFMNLVSIIGSVVMINLVGILLCLPVITIVPSFLAMYYAIAKTVRAEEGYPVKEYFHALRMFLGKGIIAEVIFAALGVLLVFNRAFVANLSGFAAVAGVIVYDICLVFLILIGVWLAPVLSRFTVSFPQYIRLLLSMAFRSLPVTLILAALTAAAGLLLWFCPVTVLFVPGLALYLSSFPAEKVLRKYMPSEEGRDDWYYRIGRKRKQEGEIQE